MSGIPEVPEIPEAPDGAKKMLPAVTNKKSYLTRFLQKNNLRMTPLEASEFKQVCNDLRLGRQSRISYLGHLKRGYSPKELIAGLKLMDEIAFSTQPVSCLILLRAMRRTSFPTDGSATELDYSDLLRQIERYQFAQRLRSAIGREEDLPGAYARVEANALHKTGWNKDPTYTSDKGSYDNYGDGNHTDKRKSERRKLR